MGMSAEVMIFVPIGIALAASLGLDKVTGTAMIAMGAASGFTAGILNPFNVGVAQDIAEIPMFSGMEYRIFIHRRSSGDQYGLHYLVRKARESGPDKEYHLRRA